MSAAAIQNVTDDDFATQVLESDTPVLVDFWAVWCGPCRAIAPHLESLATDLREKLRVVKLNVDENEHTPVTYQIRSIPTLLLFKDGEVVDQFVGNPGTKERLANFVTRHVD